MDTGWVKIHRKFLGWEWYQDPHMVHLFLHLLLNANHEEKEWKGITVERGQLVTGLPSLSENTGISIQSIRTCLERLKSTGEITSKSTNKFRVITIVKWDTYQVYDETINRQNNIQANRQVTDNQQTTNNKQEVKELKKEEVHQENDASGNGKPKRPHTLSDDEWLTAIRNNTAYSSIDIDREIAKCGAWCTTKGVACSRQRIVNWLNRAERPVVIGRAKEKWEIELEKLS